MNDVPNQQLSSNYFRHFSVDGIV